MTETRKTCESCGAPIPGGASFCTACGARQKGRSQPAAGFCTNCGEPLRPGVKFCVKCGSPAEAPPPPPPPEKKTEASPPKKKPAPESPERGKGGGNKKALIALAVLVAVALISVAVVLLSGGFQDSPDNVPAYAPPLTPEPAAAETPEPSAAQAYAPARAVELYEGGLEGCSTLVFSGAYASSEVTDAGITYYAENAIDSDTATSWQEDGDGDGVGETLTLTFDGEQPLDLLRLRLGNASSATSYANNGKPSSLLFEFSDGSSAACLFPAENENLYVRITPGVSTSYVRMTILGAYTGDRWEDTCISEVTAYTLGPGGVGEVFPVDEEGLESLIAAYYIDAAVAVMSADTWDAVWTEDAGDARPASALINIPILYAASVLLDEGSLDMDTTLPFSYTLSGRGAIPSSKDGDRLSLSYLLENLLQYSDNNAANSLISALGYDRIEDACGVFHSVDMTTLLGTDANNYVSPMEVMYMLGELWGADGTIDREYLTENLRIADSYQYLGLGAYVPSGYTFLNHNGVKGGIYSEAAVVTTDTGETYIISFMGESGSYTDTAALAADVGAYIYDCIG